jgi:hypothetical protein
MFQRWSLGFALSLTLHAGAIAVVLALALLRAPVGAVDVDVVGMDVAEVKDLPLGPPPGGAREGRAGARPRARAPRAAAAEGTLATRESSEPARPAADEPEAADDGAAARVSDLRQLGPEGSRLTVLLRTDRLKATPYAAPVDQLLQRLPDRRDLLEGTGLELYDAIDALLIATPNPRDAAVTFLAARHHLTDADLRAALERGARATGRSIAWRTEGGRPFAERHGHGAAAGGSGRDDRIIVLPARGLVVVTPPAYRGLLLARVKKPEGTPAGADTADGGAGAGDGEKPAPSWSALLRRIDAQDGLLPPEGIAMVSASDMFKPKSADTADTAVFLGMEVPRVVTGIIGLDPEPYLEITGEFAAEAEARRWEEAWPALKGKLRSNPYVVLTGFSRLVGRATLSRDGSAIHLRDTASADETLRLLEMLTRALGG